MSALKLVELCWLPRLPDLLQFWRCKNAFPLIQQFRQPQPKLPQLLNKQRPNSTCYLATTDVLLGGPATYYSATGQGPALSPNGPSSYKQSGTYRRPFTCDQVSEFLEILKTTFESLANIKKPFETCHRGHPQRGFMVM